MDPIQIPQIDRQPPLLQRLRAHFACDPSTLPVVEQQFATYERANLQLALSEMLAEPHRTSELLGVIVLDRYNAATLARISHLGSARNLDQGPVEYADVPLAGEQHLACVKNGLYLVREDNRPIAVLLAGSQQPWQPNLSVEVMADDREQAEKFSRQLTRLTRHGKAFRGHTLSVQQDCHGGLSVHFHQVPSISRDELILPQALLLRIERHTLSFNRHADKLREAKRHLKRGILLHGPPGTGKTLTAMYLASQMRDRTALVLTGAGMGSIDVACKLARMLVPATVILEDVDLIGTQRNRQTVDANALLFELLNQMDGLADDSDIIFILTTNRPDILEPALASRPGRIDQAIEIPPPDAECRQRLFDLFARGMQVQVADWDAIIARTDGVSGAFIRELLRKAAMFAAEEDGQRQLVVHDRHIEEALGELLIAGGALTQSLLGAAPAPTSIAPSGS